MSSQHEYVEVIVDTPVMDLDRPFHYGVPEHLRERIEIGSLVLVPFTRRMMVGYVVGFPARPALDMIKDVFLVLDEPPLFDLAGQRLGRWIADRYLSSLSQAFRLVTPPGRSRRVKQYVSLKVGRDEALGLLEVKKASLSDVVEVLAASSGELEAGVLQKHLGRSVQSSVTALEGLGLIGRRFVLTEPAAAPKSRLVVRLSPLALETPDAAKLPPRQSAIIEHLTASGGIEFQSDLLRETGASSSSLKSLERKGLVEISSEEVLRNPKLRGGLATPEVPVPNEHQQAAIDRVLESVSSGEHRVFLLEGVTGSGKTEVYLRCIKEVLGAGRRAIVLVPEISLTPQTVERFELRFPGEVAVLHSRLSSGERFDQWRGIRDGRYRVVVGARSAIFAPVASLGLVVIDEEHESTYKNDSTPRYHAREVAEARASMANAPLILGSATPAFESLARARAGTYVHLVLPYRIDNRPLPSVEVADMREIGGAGTVPLISPVLLDALVRTVEAGDQAILFLNRRGFANYLQCRSCGHIMGCDECEVSLCFHRTNARRQEGRSEYLMCHHCAKTWDVPPKCPVCDGGPLKRFGAGTERVEEEVLRNLPGVATIRMDADTTTTKDAHWDLIGRFRAGEAQVLIGTQMIAKGLDIPGVTLVGVINADTALALPDFRASERTYQLLTQVSGRAGRGLRPGRVIVQTFNPDHPAVRSLNEGNRDFVDSELETRRGAMYPPFAELVNVLVTSPDAKAASRGAERMKKILETELEGMGATVLGPAPAPLSRIRGQYRWHALVKCGDLSKVGSGIRKAVAVFHDYARTFPPEAEVRVTVDVDPVSLL